VEKEMKKDEFKYFSEWFFDLQFLSYKVLGFEELTHKT